MATYDFGSLMGGADDSRTPASPMFQQSNSMAVSDASATPRAGGGDLQHPQQPSNSSMAGASSHEAPRIVLDGQRPLDKQFLFSSSSVKFVGYVHTSEKFVEGKPGGINSDLLDLPTARGGVDPAAAINSAGRVWKERTFIVEPSANGWVLHIMKAKLGGEVTLKHSIRFTEMTSVDLMTSTTEGKLFRVPARTTADTTAKSHFILEFGAYISIGIGKQHLELSARNQEAMHRNYTFIVRCLEATAQLTSHFARLRESGKKLDNEPCTVHVQAITNEKTGAGAPIVFTCQMSLSAKPHEPHLQLRGEASITKLLIMAASQSASQSSSARTPPASSATPMNSADPASTGMLVSNSSMVAAAAAPTPTAAAGSPSNNSQAAAAASAAALHVDPKATIKVKGKFRLLLHPNNLTPRRTAEGIIVLVQSDEHHMVPAELRPIPGKSKLFDVDSLRSAVVECVDAMIAIGKAMTGPRAAIEALLNQSVAQTQKQQALQTAAATGGLTLDQQRLLQAQQSQSQFSSPQQGALQSQASQNFSAQQQLQQQQQPSPSRGAMLGAGGRVSSYLGSAQPGASMSASARAAGGMSSFLFSERYQGNLVEQLETGTRFRLESTFLETLRSLTLASKPTLSRSGAIGVMPSLLPTAGSSPSRIGGYFNEEVALRASHQQHFNSSSSSPSAVVSPRYLQHQMQRNGAVPIAVSQIAPQQTVIQPIKDGNWDFVHSSTWPGMMPGDDPQDFRLHLARLLQRRNPSAAAQLRQQQQQQQQAMPGTPGSAAWN